MISSASTTGAATSSAEVKIEANDISAAFASEAMWGALVSGTSVNVRAMPRISQASPPIARKIITPSIPYHSENTPPGLPLIGSTVAPNENPETMSASPPAVCTAASSAETANENRIPTSRLMTISAGDLHRIGRDVLALHGRAGQPDRQRGGDDSLDAERHLLGREDRRDREQRADAREHQEERGDRLAAAQRRKHVVERQLVHPISDGIDM